MPQKSIEQYERELMEMYRMALAKDPNYAAMAQRQSAATVRESISDQEKIDVEIPAPGVEEAVPLPEGIEPVAPQAPIVTVRPIAPEEPLVLEASAPSLKSEDPVAIAVVMPTTDTVTQSDTKTKSRTEMVVETEINTEADTETTTETTTGSALMPASDELRRVTGTPNLGAGRLIVNVTAQNRTKPVMDAVVTVSHPEESGNKVVAKVMTDSSGKTESIRLPAPIREIPVYPQPMDGGDLSAQYFVAVQASGFEPVSGEEVSIFDGVTSVKRIDLTSDSNRVGTNNSAAVTESSDAQRE
ncbi:MAG TPA: hypothetical protein VN626_11415 [Clostridia bacterium]|nr:hypothetical protein [Clostridia bacterium]